MAGPEENDGIRVETISSGISISRDAFEHLRAAREMINNQPIPKGVDVMDQGDVIEGTVAFTWKHNEDTPAEVERLNTAFRDEIVIRLERDDLPHGAYQVASCRQADAETGERFASFDVVSVGK